MMQNPERHFTDPGSIDGPLPSVTREQVLIVSTERRHVIAIPKIDESDANYFEQYAQSNREACIERVVVKKDKNQKDPTKEDIAA